MTLRQGVLSHTEREGSEITGDAPRPVYLMAHPSVAGRYVLGDAVGEAVAFLKADPIASALGRFVLDSNAAEQDRTLYLTSPTRVIV